MDVRSLVFADEPAAPPLLYACGKCRTAFPVRQYGERARDHAETCCQPKPPEPAKLCKCGTEISKWSTTCQSCRNAATIAKAEVITEAPGIMVIVGTDDYYQSVEDAAEMHPGAWVHPCDSIPLSINPKRLAESLVETVVEDACEEAFEDAAEHVNGAKALQESFEAALVTFNEAQTASSWQEDTSKVFKLPDGPIAEVAS